MVSFKPSLRATKRSAAIQKFIDCFAALLLAITILVVMPVQVRAEDKPVECSLIEKHMPSDDAIYQPGVDVYGRAVAPATLNAQTIEVPDIIKVPLSINLAERLDSLVEGLDLEAPLGMLEIGQDGSVRYNGEDWSAPVATLCGHSHKVVEEPVKPTEAEPVEDRLDEPDVIKSSQTAIEVAPSTAIPPKDIMEEPEVEDIQTIEEEENDVIEGGDYREIFYNE